MRHDTKRRRWATRTGRRRVSLAATLVAAIATLVVGFPTTGGAASTAVVDLTLQSSIVVETWQVPNLPNDPNRCITDFFVEFPNVQGAPSYTAVIFNQILQTNQSFPAGPSFPHDSYTITIAGQSKTFVAPAGRHRILVGENSSGAGCQTTPRFSIVSVTATTTTENQPPTARFNAKARALAPLTVDFDGSSSSDDKGVASYAWTYGDGGTGTGEKPSHPYASGGIYPVTLTVTDAEGLRDTHTEDVTVSACAPAPAALRRSPFSTLAVRQATFQIHVVNSAGGGVRNVRVEVKDTCTGRAVLAPATNREGRATTTLTIDGPTTVVLKGLPDGHVGDPVAENFDASGGAVTRDVELRTSETCLDRAVTVLGTDQGDELGLYPGDVVSALGGRTRSAQSRRAPILRDVSSAAATTPTRSTSSSPETDPIRSTGEMERTRSQRVAATTASSAGPTPTSSSPAVGTTRSSAAVRTTP